MQFIHRLKVNHRFALMGMLSLILALVPTVLFVRTANESMQSARQEARGVAPSKAILKVIQLVQQHRGLTAMALAGDALAQSDRANRQKDVDQAVAGLNTLLAGVQDSSVAEAWSKAQQSWKALATQVGSGGLTPAQSFGQHSALIGELFKTSDLLVDAYGLSLDPDQDSYQLVRAAVFALPALSEELGKARGRGAVMLANQTASGLDKQELAVYLSRAHEALDQMVLSFGKATRANPVLQQRLGAPVAQAVESGQKAMRLADEQLMASDVLQYSAKEYFGVFTQAIDAQVQLNGVAMDQLDQLLAGRVSRLSLQLYLLIGVIALIALLGSLVGALAARSIIQQLGAEPGQVMVIANDVAQGNLSNPIAVIRQDNSIMAAMSRMQLALQDIVSTVRGSAEAISCASAQIAHGNADLSARTSAQASALEETSASMEQLSSTVGHNADNAKQANELAQAASRIASEGGNAVSQVVGMMKGINESSRRIADIISVIDGIAFQTNILALNAAVEAARAGEQGRGFAVVAGEVRSLAQRSAEAAKEIKTLITESVNQVEQGSEIVNRAGQTMEQVVTSIRGVTELMGEISGASTEQSAGVAQVGAAMTQMDQVTQENAALVEEMASAAASLNKQAQDLVRAMSVFRIGQFEMTRPAGVLELAALPA